MSQVVLKNKDGKVVRNFDGLNIIPESDCVRVNNMHCAEKVEVLGDRKARVIHPGLTWIVPIKGQLKVGDHLFTAQTC